MRSIRLGRVFGCVLLHDAVSDMVSREHLAKAIHRTYTHTAPGGVASFQPSFVAETFAPGTETGDSDGRTAARRSAAVSGTQFRRRLAVDRHPAVEALEPAESADAVLLVMRASAACFSRHLLQ
jgi:hypothetical protein